MGVVGPLLRGEDLGLTANSSAAAALLVLASEAVSWLFRGTGKELLLAGLVAAVAAASAVGRGGVLFACCCFVRGGNWGLDFSAAAASYSCMHVSDHQLQSTA